MMPCRTLATLAALLGTAVCAHAGTIHVPPGGSIQAALDAAQPGDTIQLAPGRYLQDFRTVRDGTPTRPISIRGAPDAVISGGGAGRIAQVNHDHIVLQGFTFDGRHGDEARKEGYRDILLYVIGTRPGDGVTGLRVHGLTFRNAGGECMRMRYFAQKNEVSHSRFERCGVYDFRFDAGGKNGEAIYIGTAPEQLGRFGAPDGSVDRSDGNWIHHNAFETQGNECVDIKEGSSGNIVEHNSCTGQRDAESAGLDARGSGNVFRYNTVFGNRGSGVRLGGDGPEDGVLNEVYGNTLRNNAGAAVNAQRGPQGRICENVVSDNALGPTRGKFTEDTDPTASCSTSGGTPSRPAAPALASREQPNTAAKAEAPPATAQAPAPAQPGHARVEKKLREMGYTAWKDIQEKGEKYVEIGSARGADGKKYDIKLRASDLSVLRIEPD